MESQTDGGAVPGSVCDGKVPQDAEFDTADARVRDLDGARDIDLAQTSGDASLAEVRAEGCLETAAGDSRFVDTAHSIGHPRIVAAESLPQA